MIDVRRIAPALLLPFVLVASCAKNLEELIPFPCGDDGTCPAGLACQPNVGCTHAQFDSPCTGVTDCSPAGGGASCRMGICTVGCDDSSPCPAGHICSSSGALGGGSCLPDCSEGQSCPEGLSCHALAYGGKKGCAGGEGAVSSVLDTGCDSDADCATAGSSVRCVLGACAAPCDAQTPCAEGHLCTKAGPGQFCLVDCSAGASCLADMRCHDVWIGAQAVCMGESASVPACTGTDPNLTFPCSDSCGTNANFGVKCPGDAWCPFNSSCAADGTCQCNSGTVALTCAGAPCDAATKNCFSEPWWCQPQKTTLSCNDSDPGMASFCECASGTLEFKSCGWSLTCEQLCQNGCSWDKQDCKDPARPKCQPNATDTMVSRCVPLTGTRQEGESCTTATDPDDQLTHDDCDKGLVCSPSTGEVCRRLCRTASECTAEQICAHPFVNGDHGYCLAPCTLFQDSCPPGMACKMVAYDGTTGEHTGACFETGSGNVGDPCFSHMNCVDNLFCGPWAYCERHCNDANPCPPGPQGQAGTCNVFAAPNDGLGRCLYPPHSGGG